VGNFDGVAVGVSVGLKDNEGVLVGDLPRGLTVGEGVGKSVGYFDGDAVG